MDDYKQMIRESIATEIGEWIERLKIQTPEIKLTRQWKVFFPRGFEPGNNVLPVITGSKEGKRLIGEVSFILPETLELDTEELSLTLKDEPFKETKEPTVTPEPMEDSLDLLNRMVVSINEFLSGVEIERPGRGENRIETPFFGIDVEKKSKLNVISFDNGQSGETKLSADKLDTVKREMLASSHLPEWFKTITSYEIRDSLLEKLTEGYIHYKTKLGRDVPLREFFSEYTAHLKKTDKLHDYCPYKAKPVNLTEKGHCLEDYCSKKPYNAPCSVPVLKFGKKPKE
ncbi:hypothetical protein E3V33_00175 [Candidatus Marinimicrobia bacterium MT.SAG.4]|nr:hypothetical protein E3V33_00175 [Candidatus Marinimicrobia bacterium MT.SAG.4]